MIVVAKELEERLDKAWSRLERLEQQRAERINQIDCDTICVEIVERMVAKRQCKYMIDGIGEGRYKTYSTFRDEVLSFVGHTAENANRLAMLYDGCRTVMSYEARLRLIVREMIHPPLQ